MPWKFCLCRHRDFVHRHKLHDFLPPASSTAAHAILPAMADQPPSRFTSQNHNTSQRLSTQTVGLVNLSDFRKRRAEVLEQQDREAREASTATGPASGTSTPGGNVPTPPDRSLTGTPDNNAGNSDDARGSAAGGGPVKKKAKKAKKLLSFDDDEEEEEVVQPKKKKAGNADSDQQDTATEESGTEMKSKFKANASVGVVPKALTKAALRKEATEREALRREFLSLQEAVKGTEIAIPFVFYDGANTPGGSVRVRKGDFIWVFLDKSRKVGAELGTGDKAAARKAWARVGVDDLMLVRGSVIIPHVSDTSIR